MFRSSTEAFLLPLFFHSSPTYFSCLTQPELTNLDIGFHYLRNNIFNSSFNPSTIYSALSIHSLHTSPTVYRRGPTKPAHSQPSRCSPNTPSTSFQNHSTVRHVVGIPVNRASLTGRQKPGNTQGQLQAHSSLIHLATTPSHERTTSVSLLSHTALLTHQTAIMVDKRGPHNSGFHKRNAQNYRRAPPPPRSKTHTPRKPSKRDRTGKHQARQYCPFEAADGTETEDTENEQSPSPPSLTTSTFTDTHSIQQPAIPTTPVFTPPAYTITNFLLPFLPRLPFPTPEEFREVGCSEEGLAKSFQKPKKLPLLKMSLERRRIPPVQDY